MSQSDVYNLLIELGGRATVQEICELAKRKYPKRTLHAYISNRLLKLQKWGMVRREEREETYPLSPRRGAHSKRKIVDVWVVVDPSQHRVIA